ncbi:MAG: xylulokinase [Chloroflexota bacterium]
MSKRYLLGVDLGTSATKAALYTSDGALVAEATAEVPIYYPRPGVVEQENDDFYRTAAETIASCVRESGIDPRQIAALAFDSQMAGVGAIDKAYEPATRFDSWLDMRCQPYIEYMDQNYGELITQLTGCAPTCDHGPKILWWKEEQPRAYERIAKFVMPSAYVAGKMAGLSADEAFIDYTFLHFTGLSDTQNGTWSQQLCSLLDVDMQKLPRIVEPWHVVGEVTEEAARHFGLAPGTLIAAGCGDTAAGALGAGIVRPGMILDTAGTASVFAGCTDAFVADIEHRALLTMRSVIPGLWNPLAYVAGGGQALRWYGERFYNGQRAEGAPTAETLYAEMSKMALEAPPGADGLFFSPHLGGRICPATPEMRGAWVGFSWGHDQPHFYRAILESIAYEYAYYLSILRQAIPNLELDEARVIGGGARSDEWNQIKADVLGVPYQRLQRSEFGTWGSAMIAGKAAGIYDDLAEVALAHARPAGEAIRPRPASHEQYAPLVQKYIALQAVLADTFTETL